MAKNKCSRKDQLVEFLENFQATVLDARKNSILYIAVIDNIQMLNVAYGHIEADNIIAGLCQEIEEEVGRAWRVSDNIIAIITDDNSAETSLMTVARIKHVISVYGAQNQSAAHISSRVDFRQIRDFDKQAEKIFQELFITTSFQTKPQDTSDECEQEKSRVEMSLANQVYGALNSKRLRLAFQPIINAATGEQTHHECLLRIANENGQLESAGSFIGIAEKMGIIGNIDVYVLDMVLDKLESEKDITLALNISNATIGHAEWSKRFFERVTPELGKRLIVEITETAAMIDLPGTAYFIATLQAIGCAIALDDFGSGYTSFRQIRGLSLDYVKIDGSLIKDISNNHHNQLLVKSLIEFLKSFGVKTIAEFVDSGDTAKFLIKSGIDYMQGNYFGMASEKLSA